MNTNAGTLVDSIDNGGYYDDVWGDGTFIYAACGESGIRAYRFDGSTLTNVGSVDDGGNYRAVCGNDSFIYAARAIDGIRAYTFDGSSFSGIDNADYGGNYYDIYYNNSFIYVAISTAGLVAYTFNESGSNVFSRKDVIDNGSKYLGVYGDGTYIYTACFEDGLRAYTFDGSSFTFKGSIDDGGEYNKVWGNGTYIYTACNADGIRAYTFDGSSFTLVGSQDDGGLYKGVWGDSTYVYAACDDDGLRVYTFDGLSFRLLESVDDGDDYNAAWDNNSYIYSGSGDSGLFVYSNLGNNTPSMDSTSPVDGTSGVATSLSYVNATLSDSEGDTMNWSIDTVPDVGNSSANDEGNGTKSCSVSGLSSGTTYTVYVNVSDSFGNVLNETFTFTTYGLVTMYCYNESSPGSSISPFYIEITNSDASETYLNSSFTSGGTVGFDELPSGDNVYFLVNASGYKSRLYNFEINDISDMSFTFYLYPEVDSDITYAIESVVDHSSDETVGLGCEVDEVVFVEVYNSSIYGGWVYVADDKWSLSGNVVTVNKTVLDANSSMIRVSYYCIPLSHYIITVENEVGESVKDAYINIERLVSGSYVVVENGYTDGAGEWGVDLLPDVLYRINITHDDYDNYTSFWRPPEISQWEDSQKKFILVAPPSNYTNESSYADCVSMTGEVAGSTLYINISNSGTYCGVLTNFSIWVYEVNTSTNTTSYYNSFNSTSQDYSTSLTINNSNNYIVKIYSVHSVFGSHWTVLYIQSTNISGVGRTSTSEFEDFFDSLFGNSSIAYTGIFGMFVLMGCLFAFGQQNAGLGILMTGFVMLGFNVMFGLALLDVSICIIIVVFGILVQWNVSRRTV